MVPRVGGAGDRAKMSSTGAGDGQPKASRRRERGDSWLMAGRRRHRTTPRPTVESPETVTNCYWACVRDGDAATALYFAIDVIELLHEQYIAKGMRSRLPGLDDHPLLDNCLTAFESARRARPGASLELDASIVIVLLEEIVAAGVELGLPSSALHRHRATIAALAEHLDDLTGLEPGERAR